MRKRFKRMTQIHRQAARPSIIPIVCLVALTVLVGSRVVFRSHASGSGFVTRSGQQLLLNGQPYRMLGFNSYRANVSFALPDDTTYLENNGTTLNDTLVAINNNGGAGGGKKNVFRTWFLQQEVTPSTSGYKRHSQRV
jgi:hypothetical protein